MEGPLGIAIVVFVVIGVCVQLAIALRNRYVHQVRANGGDVEGWADAEKDVEGFEEELALQLQGELDNAIKYSTPLLDQKDLNSAEVSSAQSSPPQVRFDKTADESSWTTFKRESRSKLEHLAKSLNILSTPPELVEEDPATPPPSYTATQSQQQHSPRRQLPLLSPDGESLAERNVLVNAKQYSRILKRRYARQLIEEYFRSQSRPMGLKLSGSSMRRMRGPGGRFLSADELRAIENDGVMA